MTRPMETSLAIACGVCDWKATTEQVERGLSAAFMTAAMGHADEHKQHKVIVTYQATLYSENYQDPAPVQASQDAIQGELR